MSDLSDELISTVYDISSTGDREGLLELHALREGVDDGLWDRVSDHTKHYIDEGEWPLVDFDRDTMEFTVTEGDDVVCTAQVHEVEQPGHPTQVSPNFKPEVDFGDECEDIHKRAVEIKMNK